MKKKTFLVKLLLIVFLIFSSKVILQLSSDGDHTITLIIKCTQYMNGYEEINITTTTTKATYLRPTKEFCDKKINVTNIVLAINNNNIELKPNTTYIVFFSKNEIILYPEIIPISIEKKTCTQPLEKYYYLKIYSQKIPQKILVLEHSDDKLYTKKEFPKNLLNKTFNKGVFYVPPSRCNSPTFIMPVIDKVTIFKIEYNDSLFSYIIEGVHPISSITTLNATTTVNKETKTITTPTTTTLEPIPIEEKNEFHNYLSAKKSYLFALIVGLLLFLLSYKKEKIS